MAFAELRLDFVVKFMPDRGLMEVVVHLNN